MLTSYRELHSRPTLNVLSQDQIEQIHLATMEVLERTGVRISHLKAVSLPTEIIKEMDRMAKHWHRDSEH